jgi:hypothetical protein
VKRRGQASGFERGSPAAGFDEEKLPVELDSIGHSQPAVKIHEIKAAAQQDVLAIIDDFGTVTGNGIGSGATAQKSARLKNVDFESGLAQRCRGREPGQASADHNCRGHAALGEEAGACDHEG